MHRFLRCVISLVLICAILVNVSPMRVRAVSGTVAVAATAVAASVLIGLGLSMGTDAIQYNSLVNSVVAGIQNAGVVITNGLMDVVSIGSGLFGVRSDLIKGILDGLYANNVLEANYADTSTIWNISYNNINAEVMGNAPFSVVGFRGTYGANSYFMFAIYAFGADLSRICWRGSWRDASSATFLTNDTSLSNTSGFPVVSIGHYPDLTAFYEACAKHGTSDVESITSPYDVTLNFIAEPGISLATGYPAWHQNAVSIPNPQTGQDEEYLPLALGDTYEETIGMTQEDVWAGNGTLTDTDIETGTGTGSGSITVPETVTLSDILAGILSVPQSIAQAVAGFFADVVSAVKAIPAAITDFFTITGEDLAVPVTWIDFFPFCIPGDIWELVSVLDAEPEAPHFVYNVDFPYMDEPWHIDVDFSSWDPVAQVLRRLELLSFIVGLAMATRNYYIRG